MNFKLPIAMTSVACLMAACSGDKQSVDFTSWDRDGIYYAFPADNQTEVSRYTPIVVRLSDPADLTAATYTLTGPSGAVSHSVSIVDEDGDGNPDNKSIVITPDEPLQWASNYSLTLTDVINGQGEQVAFPGDNMTLDFQVRAATNGARSETITAETFERARMIPDGTTLPIMDFSTLRLQFTQPIDADTLEYGDLGVGSVGLYNSADELVPAGVYTKGSYLTIDPTDILDPTETYRLVITTDLQSIHGTAVTAIDETITPNDSNPRTIMVQEVTDPEGGTVKSVLTGDAINTVPLKSVLVGDQDSSEQSGMVYAELAFAPNYPEHSPLRINKASLLNGASLDVKVAGLIPTTLDTDGDGTRETPMSTGNLGVTYITDAVGFLVPNRYSSQVDAPYHALLYMDVAMTAAETEANAALSQDLLHVELSGTAIVVDGILTIDAIGIVEPEVLGLETGYGVLSFHIEGLADQENAPAQEQDTTAPVLQAWMPGDNANTVTPEDPIILTFDEPLDPTSLQQAGALDLTLNSVSEPFSWRLDGSTVVITPNNGLQFPSYDVDGGGAKANIQAAEYEVVLGSQITDLSGNAFAPPPAGTLSFSLTEQSIDNDGDITDGEVVAPIILTSYPGFPCALEDPAAVDLVAMTHGVCAFRTGWDSTSNEEDRSGNDVPDYHHNPDTLPVSMMPANRPIRLRFSKNMDESSVVLVTSSDGTCGNATAGTFRVEKVDNTKACTDIVAGRIEVSNRSITFYPDEPWEAGSFYKYTLSSVATGATCGTDAVCSTDSMPVQTALLRGPGNSADEFPANFTPGLGGPDLAIYFQGEAESTTVYQELLNLPTVDANGDFYIDVSESGFPEDPDNPGTYLVPENASRITVGTGHSGSFIFGGITVDAVNLGCGFDGSGNPEDCPEKKGVFQTGGLLAEIVGPTTWDDDGDGGAVTPEIDAVNVKLHPTTIVTSSLTLAVQATAAGFISSTVVSQTGPQIMSMRYQDNGSGDRTDLIDGYIVNGADGPEFVSNVDVFLGAPWLTNPDGTLRHNQKSLPLTLNLRGPINILPDGRMTIEQLNIDLDPSTAPDNIPLEVLVTTENSGFQVDLQVNLLIEFEDIFLQYVSSPIKK